MNKRLTQKEVEEIRKEVKKEFPNDPALQEIHMARKIITKEAKLSGKKYIEYIKLLNIESKVSGRK